MVAVDSCPVFIGRDAEMDILSAALARSGVGEPSVVIVGGEAGVGKTRLVEEFEARAKGVASVLRGQCFPAYGHGMPYAPFADLLRDLERQFPSERLAAILGPARDQLGLVVPELAVPSDPIASDDRLETRSVSRARLFELLLGIAERLQESAPAVIAIEDLQWADEASLDLLGFLVRGVRKGRILLLLTVRTDDPLTGGRILEAIGDLERTGLVERIELARFSRPEVAAQVSGILQALPPPDLLERLLRRSDGNPFFAEELLAAERRGERADVPPMLDDLLRARLATVSEAARGVLRVAAVAGPEIDDELVIAASGLPPAEVTAALREAAAHGILARTDRAPIRLTFRHTLLHESVERELLPGERRCLHSACAVALEHSARPAIVAGKIARHWLMAGRADRAIPAAVTAGLEAERRFAFADARRYFELALGLGDPAVPRPGEAELDRVGLLRHTADMAALAGDPAAAVGLARRALEESGATDDPRRAARIHERLRWYLWEAGDREAAERALLEAYRLVPVDPPSATRARVLAQLAGLRLRQDRFAESGALADKAIAVARESGALAELAFALGVRGWDRASSGQADGAIADLREAVAIAEFLERPEGRALGLANLSSILLACGRLGEALAVSSVGLDTVRAIGLERTYGGILAATAAAAAYHLGRWDEARELCAKGLAMPPPGPEALWPGAVAMRLAAGAGDRDLLAVGRALADPVLRSGADRVPAAWHRLAWIEAELHGGRAERAQELAAEATDALPRTVVDEAAGSLFALALRVAADRAEMARAVDDRADLAVQRSVAGELLLDWRRLRGSPAGSVRWPDAAAAADAACEAEARRAAGVDDPGAWERAAAACELSADVHKAAYARYREAEAMLRVARNRRPDAAGQLKAALAAARQLGARPLEAAITLLARRARLDDALVQSLVASPEAAESTARPAGDERAATFIERRNLTPREAEVLRLVSSGWSNGDIAAALFISRKTASVHVSNILGKLGVVDRVEAAALAQRAGIIGPPRPGSVLEEIGWEA